MIRFHYTIYQKLQILDLVRSGQLSKLVEQFPSVTQKQVHDWGEKEDQMRRLPLEKQMTTYIVHQGPEMKYQELFQFLYQIVKDMRQERLAVSVTNLITLAEAEDSRFSALSSSGKRSVINRFMEYFNLSIREITGYSGARPEQLEEEEKASIESFKNEYKRLIETHKIRPENVFNMDQTGIWYENPLSRTIDFIGAREVCAKVSGDEKKRLTLFTLINTTGEIFPQLAVFKGVRDGRVKKEVEGYDEWELRSTAQENAWTDGYVILEWIFKIWKPLLTHRQGNKLLLLDSYPLHTDLESKFISNGIYVLYIPTGLTWALQPLDGGFFKVFKDELKKIWSRNQRNSPLKEQDKRKAIIEHLKEVTYLMMGKDNSVYWKKQGLDYESNLIEFYEMEVENDQRENNSMLVEDSDENLFA